MFSQEEGTAQGGAGRPFQQHRDAWRRLSEELSNYREKLVPELESILSAKTLTSTPAEETTDLEKLDALCIRLRSLEVREKGRFTLVRRSDCVLCVCR